MKRVNLVVLSCCLGILCLFGFNNKEYEISNSVYMNDNNSDLVGKTVKVKGIDGNFNIMEYDGEKIRLLAGFVFGEGHSYNKEGDGEVPVAFEDSNIYQVLIDETKDWKNNIENSGGKTNIYKVDLPDVYEFYDLGYFDKEPNPYISNQYNFVSTENTPEWLFHCDGHCQWMTKSIDGNGVYSIRENWYNGKASVSVFWFRGNEYGGYGAGVKPVLETSVFNLISSDEDINKYITDLKAQEKDNAANNSEEKDKVETIKVPSTGLNGSIIFTIVGVAIIVIASIVTYIIVKDKKSKKN